MCREYVPVQRCDVICAVVFLTLHSCTRLCSSCIPLVFLLCSSCVPLVFLLCFSQRFFSAPSCASTETHPQKPHRPCLRTQHAPLAKRAPTLVVLGEGGGYCGGAGGTSRISYVSHISLFDSRLHCIVSNISLLFHTSVLCLPVCSRTRVLVLI